MLQDFVPDNTGPYPFEGYSSPFIPSDWIPEDFWLPLIFEWAPVILLALVAIFLIGSVVLGVSRLRKCSHG